MVENTIPKHTEVGLTEQKFECEHCNEVIEVPKFKNVETVVGQHITYHCDEVGLL